MGEQALLFVLCRVSIKRAFCLPEEMAYLIIRMAAWEQYIDLGMGIGAVSLAKFVEKEFGSPHRTRSR